MKRVAPQAAMATVALCVFLLFSNGCAKNSPMAPILPQSQKQAKDPAAPFAHTVQWPGETLSLIAKWYTGKISNWQAIAKANPDMDPLRIKIGMKIIIPAELITTRSAMPRDFIPKPKKPKSQEAPAPAPEQAPGKKQQEPMELFGPKDLN